MCALPYLYVLMSDFLGQLRTTNVQPQTKEFLPPVHTSSLKLDLILFYSDSNFFVCERRLKCVFTAYSEIYR